jgi:hypothetical protein
MPSRCGPPDFDERDWSQFDFSRWHLDGIALDATSAAVADLAERLFNSEEWREHFQARLPTLQKQVLGMYREHTRQLREEKAAVARDFDARIAAAQRRSEGFGKTTEAAASPPVVQPDPLTFHLAARVMAEKTRLGLPGLVVRMMDPRQPEAVLVQHVTDRDGNVVLTVPAENASQLEKRDTTLEILTPAEKSLQKIPDAVCIRLNQVETKVVALPDSPDTQPHQAAAVEVRSEREAHARNLTARIDRLRQERESRSDDLDCRLEQNENIIAALEQEMKPTPPPSGPVPEPAAGPASEPPKRERPPADRDRRRKR